MANDKYGDFEPGKVRTVKKDQPKIRLLQLWQRRSKNNEVYFSGFLGNSRIAILRDHRASEGDLPAGCEAIWQIVLEQGESREERRARAAESWDDSKPKDDEMKGDDADVQWTP